MHACSEKRKETRNKKIVELKIRGYRDGIKKSHKIGMGYESPHIMNGITQCAMLWTSIVQCLQVDDIVAMLKSTT